MTTNPAPVRWTMAAKDSTSKSSTALAYVFGGPYRGLDRAVQWVIIPYFACTIHSVLARSDLAAFSIDVLTSGRTNSMESSANLALGGNLVACIVSVLRPAGRCSVPSKACRFQNRSRLIKCVSLLL